MHNIHITTMDYFNHEMLVACIGNLVDVLVEYMAQNRGASLYPAPTKSMEAYLSKQYLELVKTHRIKHFLYFFFLVSVLVLMQVPPILLVWSNSACSYNKKRNPTMATITTS